MQIVIWLAMLVSQFLGTNFAQEWACWEDLWRSGPRYVCEYRQETPGLYASVTSEDGVHIAIFVDADIWAE